MKPIFTEGRRWFLTKAMLNLLPVVAAGALATEFFAKLGLALRIILALSFVVFGIVGFLSAPESFKRGD